MGDFEDDDLSKSLMIAELKSQLHDDGSLFSAKDKDADIVPVLIDMFSPPRWAKIVKLVGEQRKSKQHGG